MKIDMTVINTMNKQNVINLIRNYSPIYKAQISRLTGLSIPTIMKITDDFIRTGLVREVGKGPSSGGKPPRLLEFSADARYIVGVDIGTTNISTILMDLSANIRARATLATDPARCFDTVMQQVIGTIRQVLDESCLPMEKLLGIGIGVPGILSPENDSILSSPDLGWKNVSPLLVLQDVFPLPIMMRNVTRSMAMGELWFGLGKEADSFLCINLGYGIGSAIVIDRDVYAGEFSSAGEFGHITMDRNGPLCDCGNYGCLEALASANAISRQARAAVEAGNRSSMLEITGGDISAIDAKVVFDAAKAGDPLADSIARHAMEYLGIAISGAIHFLDPRLIILEGGMSRAGKYLTDIVEGEIQRRVHPFRRNTARIVVSQLGADASAIGAGAYLFKAFVERGCVLP